MGLELVDPWKPWKPLAYMSEQGDYDGKGKQTRLNISQFIPYLGLFVSITDMLSSRLKFTLRRVTAPGLTWGVTLGPDPRNASHWGGIVRMLADGRADIYTGGLTIAEDRAKVKRLPLSAKWLAERLPPHLTTQQAESIKYYWP